MAQKSVAGDPVLNPVRAVAQRTGVSGKTIYNEIRAGRLRAVRLGRRLLVSEDELHRYVQRLEDGQR